MWLVVLELELEYTELEYTELEYAKIDYVELDYVDVGVRGVSEVCGVGVYWRYAYRVGFYY